MPGLPYLFDAALSFNNKQNSPEDNALLASQRDLAVAILLKI